MQESRLEVRPHLRPAGRALAKIRASIYLLLFVPRIIKAGHLPCSLAFFLSSPNPPEHIQSPLTKPFLSEKFLIPYSGRKIKKVKKPPPAPSHPPFKKHTKHPFISTFN